MDLKEFLTRIGAMRIVAKMIEIMEKHHQALRVLMHDEPLGHDDSHD